MKYKVVALSVKGKSHEQNKKDNQDYAISYKDEQVALIVLADGAGSVYDSQIGAKIVAECTFEILKKYDEQNMEQLKEKILLRCMKEANEREISLRSLSTTLLFGIVYKENIIWGNLGDGIILAVNGEELRMISEAENGEYINETFFVNGENAEKHFRIGMINKKEAEALVLCTDGMGKLFYNKNTKEISKVCIQVKDWLKQHNELIVEKALEKELYDNCRNYVKDDLSIGIICWEDK